MILDHFAYAHNPDAFSRRVPWYFAGKLAGSFHTDWLTLAQQHLGQDLNTNSLSAVQDLCQAIKAQVSRWQDEPFGFYLAGQDHAIGQVPRGAVPHLGLQAYGVHANGYVRKADGLHMWVAKRAQDKMTFPGQWDNLVGGGLTADYSPDEVLAKETDEEAGLAIEQVRRVDFVGRLSYQHAHEGGLRNDCLFVYDLELPEDLVPTPKDGEVERFECWPLATLIDVIDTSDAFKYNCNLVVTEFLMRHGALDLHPKREQIQQALNERFQPA